MRKKFMLVFGLAFIIRLISLNQSLWLDEAITAKVIKQFTLFQISSLFSPTDFHPPLYYLFMKLWSTLFGVGEIAVRLPSVIFSLLTGHAVFLIATRIRNQKFGLWAAALYLFNPLAVYYSQEARMYSLVTFLLAFAAYFGFELLRLHENTHKHRLNGHIYSLIDFIRQKLIRRDSVVSIFDIKEKRILLLFFNLFLILALWTFYGSIFFVASFLLLLLTKKRYKEVGITVVVLSVSFALQLPLLITQLHNAQVLQKEAQNWALVLGPATIKNLLLIPIKFAFGRISFYPKFLYYVIAGLWTSFVFSYVILGAFKAKRLAFIFSLPLLLGFIFSFFSPLMQYFRFLYLLPIMSILIAEGVEHYLSIKKKKGFLHFLHFFKKNQEKKLIHQIRENAIMEILIGIFLFLSLIYLFFPLHHREDWKSMAQVLPLNKTIYMILPSSDPLLYYRGLPVKELRNIETEWIFEKEIYIIPYTVPIYGFDYEGKLHNKGCYRKEKRVFHQVFFERWVCGFISSSCTHIQQG